MVEMARSAFPGRLSPQEQMTLYTTLRADDIQVSRGQPDRVYDIEIANISLDLPTTNLDLAHREVYTDKRILKRIIDDNVQAIAKATEVVASLPYGRVTIEHAVDFGKADAAAMGRFEQQIRDLREKTGKAMAERRQNPEKYAGDLSSRFAAMNAFRKSR
jgi:hypothetical protein